MVDDRMGLFKSYMEVIVEKDAEIALLKKKLADAERIGEKILDNSAKELSWYVDGGSWCCEYWQFLDKLLKLLGKKSWRIEAREVSERWEQMVNRYLKEKNDIDKVDVSEFDEEAENS